MQVDHPEVAKLDRPDDLLTDQSMQVLLGIAGVAHRPGDADEILVGWLRLEDVSVMSMLRPFFGALNAA